VAFVPRPWKDLEDVECATGYVPPPESAPIVEAMAPPNSLMTAVTGVKEPDKFYALHLTGASPLRAVTTAWTFS
jgi:hypothetical protein